MKTVEEVKHAFTNVVKLTESQKMRLLRLEVTFKDVALEIADLVPECHERAVVLRKLLEAKFLSSQIVSHGYGETKSSGKAKEV